MASISRPQRKYFHVHTKLWHHIWSDFFLFNYFLNYSCFNKYWPGHRNKLYMNTVCPHKFIEELGAMHRTEGCFSNSFNLSTMNEWFYELVTFKVDKLVTIQAGPFYIVYPLHLYFVCYAARYWWWVNLLERQWFRQRRHWKATRFTFIKACQKASTQSLHS